MTRHGRGTPTRRKASSPDYNLAYSDSSSRYPSPPPHPLLLLLSMSVEQGADDVASSTLTLNATEQSKSDQPVVVPAHTPCDSARSSMAHWHPETMFSSSSTTGGLGGSIAVASVILGTVGLVVVRSPPLSLFLRLLLVLTQDYYFMLLMESRVLWPSCSHPYSIPHRPGRHRRGNRMPFPRHGRR